MHINKNFVIINLIILLCGAILYILLFLSPFSAKQLPENNENSISYVAPKNKLGVFYPEHNRNKKQILVLGYYGAYNYGDEIMLKSLLPQLDKNAEISVMFHPSARYNFEQFDSVFHYYPPKIQDAEKIADFYDELIIGGGAHIDDNPQNGLPKFMLLLSKEMIKRHKDVRWLAVSANKELSNKNFIDDLKFVVENCTEFFVRDTYSKNLLEKLGIDKNKIKLKRDLALDLPKRKTIAVTLKNSFREDDKMAEFIQEIVDFAKDSKEDYQICFLSFFNQNHSDTKMYKKLLEKVDFKGIPYFISAEYQNIEDMLLFIKASDLFVNMRYHGALLAMEYDKPNITICYDKHPHYWNKIHYIHEQYNNENIISYKDYKKNDLYNMLVKVAKEENKKQ